MGIGMAIRVDEEKSFFCLETKNSCYQLQADRIGVLLHLYYGRPVPEAAAYRLPFGDVGFSGNPYELGTDRTYSLDCLPQEFPSSGVGDYREESIEAVFPDGSRGVDFRYQGYEVLEGAYQLEGLPTAWDGEEKSQTLVIRLKDTAKQAELELYYGVFPECDVITRAARFVNLGEDGISLNRMLSANVDFLTGEWELLYLPGRHAMERSVERTSVGHAALQLGSRRGTSSHQMNPSCILCAEGSGEESGDCYSFQLVYSGSFLISAQKDQRGLTRVALGVQPDQFSFRLEKGESFVTPQAVLSYSPDGLGGLSRQLHRFVNRHICRGIWQQKTRPVLINNWEATYFDFNLDKLTGIAAQAAELGIDMMVLDDGWFGKRDTDLSGLGDWTVNEAKLGGTMASLAERISEMGMRFGLWFEPEMISEDSELYRQHPDWALTMPGRAPGRSRYQLVLDMSRADVREYLFAQISGILKGAEISYVKWDMNRSVSDAYSALLGAGRQGEVYHRYVLGVYDLMKRLTEAFPEVLFEGCSGGGGRFDLGILCYSPQIWCSDNTDAVNRMSIQYGTSLFYPIGTVGSHVSVCPNHQTGRTTPFETRAVVAMAGSFGYEMDLQKLLPREKQMVKEQLALYRRFYGLIHDGDYYRLTAPGEKAFMAWEFVDEKREGALLSLVRTGAEGNPLPEWVRLKGLEPEAEYELEVLTGGNDAGQESCGAEAAQVYSGAALMYAGLLLPAGLGEYDSWQICLKRK